MSVKKEVVDKLATLITAAFGFVAALAWNDAVKSLFAEEGFFYFLAGFSVWIYAVVVTVAAVLITIWIGRFAGRVK